MILWTPSSKGIKAGFREEVYNNEDLNDVITACVIHKVEV